MGGLGKDVKQSKQLLARIPIKTKFKKIATGDSHCVAIDEDDHLWSWGFNDERQCGHGHNDKCIWKPTLIESMKNIKISQICAGRYHCLALSTELDTVYAWGSNDYFQCGNGKKDNVVNPTSIGTLKGKKIKIIKTGRYYNLAVTQSNDYYYACLDYDTVKHVKIPKLAFTDKYQKINDVFLGYNITQIVYTVSGKQQSFDMKQGLKNGFMRFDILKLVLDEEPIVAAEEKKNIEYNDDSKVDNELQHVDDNKLDDDNKANNKSNNDDLKDKNKQKQNEKELLDAKNKMEQERQRKEQELEKERLRLQKEFEEKKRKEEEEAAEALKLAEEEEAAKKKAEEEEAERLRLEQEEKKRKEEEEAAAKKKEEEEAAKKKAEEEEAGRVRLEEEEKKKRGRRSCSK